jgi:hypothetical protein
MPPAFSSTRQAAAFALLVAVLLALPALVARTGWLKRRDVYAATPWKCGPFPWIQQQIFAETKDADVVFLGSSRIWAAFNTPFVQQKLSEQLGREAEVFTLAWPWPGFDAAYLIARDLLDRRRVHMLVIHDESRTWSGPQINSWRWFRIGENSEALAGLSWLDQARLFGGAVLGMPRQLLSLVRPNLLEDVAACKTNFWSTERGALDFVETRGAYAARLAWGMSLDFVPFRTHGDATSADALIYSAETREAFKFTDRAMVPYERHFARKLARLCQERGTRLVFLHTAVLSERGQTVISERQFWPGVLGAPADIVGIPPAKMFAGIPEADLPKLFYNDYHLNQSGQEMFTPLITPELLKLYATPTIRH